MAQKPPEKKLETFLASCPAYLRKDLQGESWTSEDTEEWGTADWKRDQALRAEYEQLLQAVPAEWQKYAKRWAKIAQSVLPARKHGRPRLDWLAGEAARLRRLGKTYGQTSRLLNREYGLQTTVAGLRMLLESRKSKRSEENPG